MRRVVEWDEGSRLQSALTCCAQESQEKRDSCLRLKDGRDEDTVTGKLAHGIDDGGRSGRIRRLDEHWKAGGGSGWLARGSIADDEGFDSEDVGERSVLGAVQFQQWAERWGVGEL